MVPSLMLEDSGDIHNIVNGENEEDRKYNVIHI